MSWESRLLDLFDDLEQQAEGAALAARDAEVAELARAEYSEVDLASRFHASIGLAVELFGPAGRVVRGRMARAGDGWCLVARPGDGAAGPEQEWLVVLAGLMGARGLAAHARPSALRPLVARLGLSSVLRGLAEEQDAVTVVRSDGERRRGRLGRVGRDFVELAGENGRPELVPFSSLVAVQR